MGDFIKEWGQVIITAITGVILMGLIFGGVYFGVVGVLAGMGEASSKTTSNIGSFVKTSMENDREITITAELAPKLGNSDPENTYDLYSDLDNSLFKTSETIDGETKNITVQSFKVIRIYDNEGNPYSQESCKCTNSQITFNKRGFYNLLVEVKDGNKCWRKVFKFIIVDEEGNWQ